MIPTWMRSLRLAVLALGLAAFAPAASAQDEGFTPGNEEADPLMGYLATGAVAGAVIFVLCKSSRRAA